MKTEDERKGKGGRRWLRGWREIWRICMMYLKEIVSLKLSNTHNECSPINVNKNER